MRPLLGCVLLCLLLPLSGMNAGWRWKAIKNSQYFDRFHRSAAWQALAQDADSLEQAYQQSLDPTLRSDIRSMFRQDQKMALGALVRIFAYLGDLDSTSDIGRVNAERSQLGLRSLALTQCPRRSGESQRPEHGTKW